MRAHFAFCHSEPFASCHSEGVKRPKNLTQDNKQTFSNRNFESIRIIRYKNGAVKVNELFVELLDQMVTMGDTARQLKEALSGDCHRPGELLKKVMSTHKQATR
jgi:hypothetical protein